MKLFSKVAIPLIFCGFLTACTSGSKTIAQPLPFIAQEASSAEKKNQIDEPLPDYYTEDRIRYEDHTYLNNINTAQLHPTGAPMAPPILQLGEEGTLRLSFDDFNTELTDYSYSFIHCDASWAPSDMDPNQFIDGLPEDDILNYDYSRNTVQRYVHYDLTFPNRNMDFRISGNYVIKVYNSDDPNQLVLTRRFMIAEKKVVINPEFKRGTRVEDRNTGQEIDFKLNFSGNYLLTNPYTDLKVTVLQNMRWDNALTKLQPTFVKDRELVYDGNADNVFNGGNEFRFVDIKDLQFRTGTIERLIFAQPDNHAYLAKEKKRAFKIYLERPDIDGKRLITMGRNQPTPDVDGDYVHVHFTLDYNQMLPGGDLYIQGALTDWRFEPASRMVFDARNLVYKTTLYLKQGYYNYQYVFLPDGKTKGDETLIEGSHFQTTNAYTILVYHRTPGIFYDRLIAAETFPFPPER